MPFQTRLLSLLEERPSPPFECPKRSYPRIFRRHRDLIIHPLCLQYKPPHPPPLPLTKGFRVPLVRAIEEIRKRADDEYDDIYDAFSTTADIVYALVDPKDR